MKIGETYRMAIRAAVEASGIIMEYYNSSFHHQLKADGSPVTQADLASSERISLILKQTGIPIIDEESEEISYEIRKNWTHCWCVDPLDGTKEFIKKNGEFAVNIALIENGKAIFGLIASPVNREILLGIEETAVYRFSFADAETPEKWRRLNWKKKEGAFNMISSRTYYYSGPILDFVTKLQERFGTFGVIRKGSSLKFFELAENEASVYPRYAPTMEWDIAAGQAILEALGGTVLHAENRTPLVYNKPNLKNPYFIGLTRDFVDELKSWK